MGKLEECPNFSLGSRLQDASKKGIGKLKNNELDLVLKEMPKDHQSVTPELLEIFMVYGTLHTGGIETLIVRLSNFLVTSGFSTSVYCMPGGDLQPSLNSNVNVVNYSGVEELISNIKNEREKKYRGGRVFILSFDSTSAARALMIEMALPKMVQVVHVTGIFHPHCYFMPGQPLDRILLNYFITFAIGKKNIFFMNEECRSEHAKKWRSDLSICPVLPLPINAVDSLWQPSRNSSIRIVSVGRLVDFKAYSLGAARIVKSCLDRGIDVSWDIFGYGPLEAQIKSNIEAMGVEQNVRLMGKLDYDDFSKKVASYDLFVGMGTAAVEAAMVGVPTICAVVDELSSCHGYLCDLPLGNVGEFIENRPLIEIEGLIHSFAASDVGARMLLSERGVKAAKLYGMPTFVESLMNMMDACDPSSSRIKKYVIGNFYHLMTEGLFARLFFGRGLKTRLLRFIR